MAYLDLTGLGYFKDKLIDPTLSVAGKAAEDKAVGDAVADFLPTDTSSGAIASFADGAEDTPVKALTVDIEPVQDLNGQSSPYPPGGSKNKLPLMGDASATVNGVTFKVKDGVITVNGTATAQAEFDIPLLESVDLSPSTNQIAFLNDKTVGNAYVGAYRNGTRIHYWAMSPTNRIATDWTDTGNEVVDTIRVWLSANESANNLTISPMLMAKTETDYTWKPYSNICPISGFAQATVTRTGVNVWDEEWEVGGIRPRDGALINEQRIRSKNLIPCVPNTTYYFLDPTNNDNLRVFYYAEDGSYISCTSFIMGAQTTPNNARFMRFIVATSYGTTYLNNISINYPSTDTEYHAHEPIQTITIDLGETRYGGTLDVVNKVLTVDRILFTPTQCNTVAYSSGVGVYYTVLTAPKRAAVDYSTATDLCPTE